MDWVKGHIQGAKMLGKPLCLQEFGKRPAGRARTKLFKKVRQTCQRARPLGGAARRGVARGGARGCSL